MNRRIMAVIWAALPPVAVWAAQSSWAEDPTVQQQLAGGQVAVEVLSDGDGPRTRLRAAVKVNATPEAIWSVLTDCDHAAGFIPGVKHCHRVQTAADGSWEIIEQEAQYSWYMPTVKCVMRLDYKRPQRIDFKRISGDLKEGSGEWLLLPEGHPGPSAGTAGASPAPVAAAGGATIVEYELNVEPGFWVPRVLLRHSLRSELPAALTALRERAESVSARLAH